MGRGISAGTMGIVILAILAGLIGAYIIRASLIKQPVVETRPATVTIPLASVDLPEGRTVALGDVALTSMTFAEAQERGYDLTKTMTDPQQIIGRILHEPLRQGKPFLTDVFYLQGTRYDFTKDLKPGFRAISLQVPKSLGGNLPVGSTVDIMFRSTERKGDAAVGRMGIPEVTVRLLEGLKIIDVYEPPPPPARSRQNLDITQSNLSRTPPPPTVTLAVTPEQASVIQATLGRGEMTLVARPTDERLAAAGKRKGLTLEDVLGIEPPPPTILFATELYRRGSRSVNVFRDDKLVEQIKAEQKEKEQAPPPPPAPAPGAGVVPPPAPQTVPVPVPVPVPFVPGAPGAAVPVPVPVPVPVVP